jgi:hypothetical protein
VAHEGKQDATAWLNQLASHLSASPDDSAAAAAGGGVMESASPGAPLSQPINALHIKGGF